MEGSINDYDIQVNQQSVQASTTQDPAPLDSQFEIVEDTEEIISERLEQQKLRDQDSKTTGHLMLMGWCMTEFYCDDCMNPIMRSRKGETKCVRCGPVDISDGNQTSKSVYEAEKVIKEEPETEMMEEKVPQQVEQPKRQNVKYVDMSSPQPNIPATQENIEALDRQLELEWRMAKLQAVQEIKSMGDKSALEKWRLMNSLQSKDSYPNWVPIIELNNVDRLLP